MKTGRCRLQVHLCRRVDLIDVGVLRLQVLQEARVVPQQHLFAMQKLQQSERGQLLTLQRRRAQRPLRSCDEPPRLVYVCIAVDERFEMHFLEQLGAGKLAE